jgi:hypothetical protein
VKRKRTTSADLRKEWESSAASAHFWGSLISAQEKASGAHETKLKRNSRHDKQ